jgi:hypothetical protein
MRASIPRKAVTIGATFLFLLSFGCGNPEAPEITRVRLSYWDVLTGDGSWVSLDEGEPAPQSPIRIQGNITDNTAVVSPMLVWVGERRDVEEDGFTQCTEGTDEFYECEMRCEGEGGFFECNPPLASNKLVRGDRFQLTFTTSEGEEHELEVRVSEGRSLFVPESEAEPIEVLEDYRILKLFSQTGQPNPFLWSLLRWNAALGDWVPLRYGDSLALHAGDDTFQLAVEEPEGVELEGPPTAAWRSLVKWNDDAPLNWDATSGDFEEILQVFDPRVRDPESGEVTDGQEPPRYRFAASAQDVPDQKTGVFRTSTVSRDFTFSPVPATRRPDLEVDVEEEALIETSTPAENVTGSVESFSGEVRSLLFRLPDPFVAEEPRVLYFNPESVSLTGDFVATVVYVSDWDDDGVVDDLEEGIANNLEVIALDMVQGRNWTRTTVPIVFTPATDVDGVPELQVMDLFPKLDSGETAQLPFGEVVRVRARAADDRGQPAFAAYQCNCVTAEIPINEDRCPCDALTGGVETPEREDDLMDLNTGGEYPRNPWEWVSFEPSSETNDTVGVLQAREKVDDARDLPTAKFSAIEIDLQPESQEEAYEVSVSLPETVGPNVLLVGLENGDPVDPEGFVVQATIFANVSGLNQIKALWNGRPAGAGDPEPTFDTGSGLFLWDFTGETITERDRICVGAISVTGHAALTLLEFASTAEGLRLGVTLTSDTGECEQLP